MMLILYTVVVTLIVVTEDNESLLLLLLIEVIKGTLTVLAIYIGSVIMGGHQNFSVLHPG